jgi:lysophospholipase L1-like esterase
MLKKRIKKYWKYGKVVIDFEVHDDVDINEPVVKGFIAFDGTDTTNFTPKAFDFLSNHYTEIIDKSNEKDEILADLEDFLQILLAHDITPIIITLPTYTEYNKYLEKAYVDGNIKASKKIAQKYNVKYWSFFDSAKFTIDDFHDMEHLNRKGAVKFSSMLNDSINKLEKESKLANQSYSAR